MINEGHWSNYLPTWLPMGKPAEVKVTVDAENDRPAVVVLISRLQGLVEALRHRDVDGRDPLLDEDEDDLYTLLLHLHMVRMVIEGQEERVLSRCAEKKIALERLASALELSGKSAVSYRLRRIKEAAKSGQSAAGMDEAQLDEFARVVGEEC
ncbi:hypothetical protein [Streptomyces sp. NPDC051173]|uniref:hypothetical protein n=1 Tax=Streptomyces sp. NPDC051173 TaxID=3155164 RepID=UPI00344E2B0F